MVDVVGIVPNLSASLCGGRIRLISEFFAKELFLLEQIEIILMDCFFEKSKRSFSS